MPAVVLFFIIIFNTGQDLQKARTCFSKLSSGESQTQELKSISIASKELSNSLKTAYYAAGEMGSAQYKLSPIAKINCFNTGKKILESAVISDPNNLEIRFIRYAIQLKCPAFLGYTKNLNEDKTILLNGLSRIRSSDKELYAYISSFLLQFANLSAEEKQIFK